MSETEFKKTMHSAMYNFLDGMIVSRSRGDMFRVIELIEDIHADEEIQHPESLKLKLWSGIPYRNICDNYNKRIDNYKLDSPRLDKQNYKNLKLVKPKVSKGLGSNVTCGLVELFPRTFVCNNYRCNHFVSYSKSWQIKKDISAGKLNFNNCGYRGCKGRLEPVTLIAFCQNGCGHLRELSYWCGKCKSSDHVYLKRPDADSVITWRFGCRGCGSNEVDPLAIMWCDHSKRKHFHSSENTKNKYSSKPADGITSPVVITTVDLPKVAGDPELNQYVSLAFHLNLIKDVDGKPITKKNLEKRFSRYESQNAKDMFLEDLEDDGENITDKAFVQRQWRKKCRMNEVLQAINKLMEEFSGSKNLDSVMEYQQLKESVDNDRFKLTESQPGLAEIFNEDFSISEISYVHDINLISAAMGVIFGDNKWWEEDFVPHFEPLWEKSPWASGSSFDENNNKFKVYVNPFQTEGMLIELNKKRIVEWLKSNEFPNELSNESDDDALLKLSKYSEKSYRLLETLIHTYSHIILKRAALYSGIDESSYAEMLFPEVGALFIYSTASIKTGGIQHAFESSLEKWIGNLKLEVSDCSMDPLCIRETGSCFSCLHVAEFVCCNFNKRLDRGVLLGTEENTNESSRITIPKGFL